MFPFVLKKEDISFLTDFVSKWLSQVDYGTEPDHDGSNGKGWTVWNDSWGRVNGEWQSFVAIKPTWAMYGK
jgi:hypothetical protein